jgi:hypothetical protein
MVFSLKKSILFWPEELPLSWPEKAKDKDTRFIPKTSRLIIKFVCHKEVFLVSREGKGSFFIF